MFGGQEPAAALFLNPGNLPSEMKEVAHVSPTSRSCLDLTYCVNKVYAEPKPQELKTNMT